DDDIRRSCEVQRFFGCLQVEVIRFCYLAFWCRCEATGQRGGSECQCSEWSGRCCALCVRQAAGPHFQQEVWFRRRL
ncbi:hypothetical protein Drorol1_Dr00008937, partial [Drosera rotundifolia]